MQQQRILKKCKQEFLKAVPQSYDTMEFTRRISTF
jgi:hypothetical protein